MITTKAPKIEDIGRYFSIAIYTDSLRKRQIYSPSGFKTIYCDAKDIWSCRTQMMRYINTHLSDFVSSKNEEIRTLIRKGWFGKIYSSPVRVNGKWVIDRYPYDREGTPGKYTKVPSKPRRR